MNSPRVQQAEFLAVEDAVSDRWARWATLNCPLLVLGETGTGKSILARRLHHISPRSHGPLVTCSLAELPDELGWSELFGHVRGAFTGAHSDRAGVFETAHLGTAILEEIAKGSLRMQGGLLRAVEERKVTRLGEQRERPVDFRLIAVSNRDLEAMVRRGEFLDDLLARFGYYVITLAPLRDQPSRILELAAAFLAAETPVVGRARAPVLSREVQQLLLKAPWPGNARDLHNLCRYLAGNAGDTAFVGDLPDTFLSTLGMESGHAEESAPERAKRVLVEEGGNKARAARRLRVSRSHLYRLLGGDSTQTT